MAIGRTELDGGGSAAIARAWLLRLKSGDATQDDVRELARWRSENAAHEDAYRAELRLWHALGPALAGQSATRPPLVRHISRRGLLGGGAAVAASIALVAVVGVSPAPAGATVIETGKGERRTLDVARGVRVELNTDSRLFYWADADRLTLDRGEAVVSVRHAGDKRLSATVGDTRVLASRARFQLRDGDLGARVLCLEGEIAIAAEGRTYALAKGHSLAVADGSVRLDTSTAPVAEAETAWRRGLLVFNDRPAGEVVAELNRHRAGRVFLPDERADIRISGVIHLDRADLAVDHIARSLGMKVVKLPGGVAILRS